jgi:predicted DsbA family dithiol-disulfide isomerase
MRFSSLIRCLNVAAALLVLLAGCSRTPESAAAYVPDTDVRILPNDRKVGLPDRMMEAADVSRVIGRDSAPVRLLVVSDYQCDSCRTWFEQYLPALRAEYVETGKARLTWVHYPLKEHPGAVRAASAALCAGVQGKFWDASARLFSGQAVWGSSPRAHAIIDSLASVPGIESFTLRNCIESNRMLRQVRRDIDWADTVKAGTPLIVLVGKRRIAGSASLAAFRATLDSAISGK